MLRISKETDPLVTFDNGYPSGGVYKLDGITATSLDPSVASAGNHTLIYNYTSANGCSGKDSAGVQFGQ